MWNNKQISLVSLCTTRKGYGARRLKAFDVQPYITRKGGTMVRGNVGARGLKGFNGWPIVTRDDTIIMAKRCGSKGLDVWPIVTCDNVIVTA